ncbi:MAG TPA: hypothetical protein VKC58_14735 [Myxococcales bacterium]|nr:hypothetical protein [Myxococcales bacterium]
MGSDRSGQSNPSSTYGQNNPSTSSDSSSTSPGSSSGSTYGQSGTGSSGSTSGQSGTGSSTGSGSYGSTGSSGSTYGQSGTGSSGSTYGQSGTGSSTGSGSYGSSGSTSGQSGSAQSDTSTGTSSSRGSMDRGSSAGSMANLKSAVGRVSKVDPDNKSVVISSRQGDRITLTVDDNTQIVDSSGSASSDLSAIREGAQVRASFDPASNRAEKIEVMGKSGKKGMHKKSASGDTTTEGTMKGKAPNANDAKQPPQDTTGAASNPK